MLLGTFQALQAHRSRTRPPRRPSSRASSTRDRELPEARVRKMLEQVLASPLVPKVAALIEKRLGRPLEPFDIWYAGFKPRGKYTEAQLDEIVRKKYPTPEAYQAGHAAHAPGAGLHAGAGASTWRPTSSWTRRAARATPGAPQLRTAPAHLRTRVDDGGMNYKGYNIAVHEMGHNVEQTFSLNDIDHSLLNGVPNTAFTEALAFVFQAKDLELLGLSQARPRRRGAAHAQRFLGHLRDRRRRAGGHGRLALDVRPPGRHPGAAEGGRARNRARHLEPLLRAGLQDAGRRAARHLLAHDRRAISTCPTTPSAT